jgi:hypothetical protein
MALDPVFETRYITREVTDPTTGPYLTGANLVSTVESLVASINAELVTLAGADSTAVTNIQKLAGQVLGSETLPVPTVVTDQDVDYRLDALEASAATFLTSATAATTYVDLAEVKALVAAAADFAAFKTAFASLGA